MATGKRYYWIKLKDSFMSSDEIDYLMSQPDGANYVVLYQMLCLKTINTNGCLVSKIGEMLIPYDAEKIQRECKWFPLSTVRLALTVYKQIGLIFENPDGTLSISDYQNMIGSETDWAAKNRRIRSNAANKELQEGHDTGHTSGHNVSSDGGENVPTEKEIEKELEIEKETESDAEKELFPESQTAAAAVPETTTTTGSRKKGTAFSKPTLEEIRNYCMHRGSTVSAEQFYDYYEANGWNIGKHPMRDWKAALRTWERHEKPSCPDKPQPPRCENAEAYASFVYNLT